MFDIMSGAKVVYRKKKKVNIVEKSIAFSLHSYSQTYIDIFNVRIFNLWF